ncbi:MAG: amidohydrolase [Calditrichae bacterium]|nr:amidohydrolase [Calditrichia bacterium]
MKNLIFLFLFIISCSKQEKADLIIYNGNIATLNPDQPGAELISVRGDRISYIGKNTAMDSLKSDNTILIDAAGKRIIPAFIEGHAHFLSLGGSLLNLDLTTIKNWDEAVNLVQEAVLKSKPGDWIIGRGWHQEKWETVPSPSVKGYPTHQSISQVSPENPVMLNHASGHGVFVNARAMQLAGITAQTPDTTGGEIIRDEQGNPTGIFLETAEELIYRVYQKYLQALSPAEQQREYFKRIDAASMHCLENGVATFHDAGASLREINLFKDLADKDSLDLRLWVMISASEILNDSVLQKYKMIGAGNNHLTVRSIKQYIDGALGSRGAWMLKPYSDMPSTTGQNVTPLDSIRKVAELAFNNDYQLCTHAIGDRGDREMLDIYEYFLQGDLSRRWRIEHAQHLSLQDIPRFAELGIIASMQTVHCTSDGPWVPKRIGDKRAEEGAYVWQKLLKSGAHLANGTDAPVERVSPIENYYAAVTRRLPDGSQFYPDQVLSREEALKSLTLWNAYAGFEEDIKGSLEVGKLADIVILSQDILTIPEDKIKDTKVDYTFVGGKTKYKR